MFVLWQVEGATVHVLFLLLLLFVFFLGGITQFTGISFERVISIFSAFQFQFLCMKNIRTFLQTCSKSFGLREADLFQPHDLFDVKDFRKVCY